MQKFRKKPAVIEAMQYNEDNLAEVLAFTGKHPRWDEWFSSFEQYQNHVRNDGFRFKILTLEGTMIAVPGDWIIRGVKGEFYPCKPDIFAATYDAVIEEDEFTCIGCGNIIQEGELVFHEHGEGGLIHAECAGPEREFYCTDEGEPLGPEDPLPTPFPYVRAEYFPTDGPTCGADAICEPWVECWYGSDPGKGASVWSQTAYGTHKNMLFHVGPEKAHLELARTIAATHNASLRARSSSSGE